MGDDLDKSSAITSPVAARELSTALMRKADGCTDVPANMDPELWGSLPRAMVEEVLARLPIKLLFQCRVLSRAWTWSGRLSSRKKLPLRFLEKTITSVASRWPTFCPVYLFQEGLLGFNRGTEAWEKIFDLKMFPFLPEGVDTTTGTSCAGSLVCFASVNFLTTVEIEFDSYDEWLSWNYRPLDHEIYVVNVVTKKWKRLPRRPNMQRPNIIHLVAVGSSDYEIVLLTQLEHTEGFFVASTVVTQIYHSASKSWTEKSSKSLLPKWRTSLSNFVYLDGVFYIASGSSASNDPPLLMTHNVDKGTWNTMIPPLPIQLRQLVKYYVLLCGSDLILVVKMVSVNTVEDDTCYRDVFSRNHTFLIFKLDLASGLIKEVSRCPHDRLAGVSIDQVLAFGDSIYFGGKYIPKTPMMIYNVRIQDWTYHSSSWEMPKLRESCVVPLRNGHNYCREPDVFYWTRYALQPGLNPFAEV